MRKIHAPIAAIALFASAACNASDHPITQLIHSPAGGMCVNAGTVYEPGEMLTFGDGHTKICMQISGQAFWSSADEKIRVGMNF